MIFTVLVGNTNTRLAWFAGRRLVRCRVVSTNALLKDLDRHLKQRVRVSGSALASVVPAATRPVTAALRRTSGSLPMVVDRRTRTPLRVDYDRSQLGADRLCVALGAHLRYPGNTVVIDFGTATTVNVVTAEGRFLGGLILPGIGMMLHSLADSTARLPLVPAVGPHPAIAHNTEAAIRSGVTRVLAGGLDRILSEIERASGRSYRVVATGGGAGLMRRVLRPISRVDPDLASHGLAGIYRVNRPAND